MVAGDVAEPISRAHIRPGVRRRAGIGAQPIDGTNNRKSHQPGSFRHTAESGTGRADAVPPLTTRKRA